MSETAAVAKPALPRRNGTQFATFFVTDLYFGIDVLDVQEVMRHREMTRVPLAPAVVEGLINLRGQIVTAIDMRRTLHLPPRGGEENATNIVVRTPEGAVSLLVDEIGDVVEVDENSFEPPPETLRGSVRTIILGVHKLNDRLMHVLDIEKACQMTEAAEKATAGR